MILQTLLQLQHPLLHLQVLCCHTLGSFRLRSALGARPRPAVSYSRPPPRTPVNRRVPPPAAAELLAGPSSLARKVASRESASDNTRQGPEEAAAVVFARTLYLTKCVIVDTPLGQGSRSTTVSPPLVCHAIFDPPVGNQKNRPCELAVIDTHQGLTVL